MCTRYSSVRSTWFRIRQEESGAGGGQEHLHFLPWYYSQRGHNFCSVKFVYYEDGTMPKAYAAFWERASITPRLTDRKFPLKAH